MIRDIGSLPDDRDSGPVDLEGFGAVCCECGAVLCCDTRAEQDALHNGESVCPRCGSELDVCAGPCCVLASPLRLPNGMTGVPIIADGAWQAVTE